MPLGGSITYGVGSSHGQGYRHHLYKLLTANGFNVTMTGSRGAGAMRSSAHEGWRGYRIDQIFNKTRKSITASKPDVFTINAGSNDCLQDFDLNHAGQRMSEMVRYIWSEAPKSTVLLSTLLHNGCATTEKRICGVNQPFRQMVDDMAAEGHKIILVDMHTTAAPQTDDLTDGTHPNDRGYEKMAEIWFKGIKEAARRGYL